MKGIGFSTTPGEPLLKLYEKISREVLEEKYLSLQMSGNFKIEEDLQDEVTKIRCVIEATGSQDRSTMVIEGEGEGPIDAFFKSIKKELSGEYKSLKTFRFKEFGAVTEVSNGTSKLGLSAAVETLLVVQNDRGEDLVFRNKSTSVNRASVKSVLKAVEYFVNTEKAVKLLHAAIKDAKERNRGDLVVAYTLKLSELVRTTSYDNILDKGENE